MITSIRGYNTKVECEQQKMSLEMAIIVMVPLGCLHESLFIQLI